MRKSSSECSNSSSVPRQIFAAPCEKLWALFAISDRPVRWDKAKRVHCGPCPTDLLSLQMLPWESFTSGEVSQAHQGGKCLSVHASDSQNEHFVQFQKINYPCSFDLHVCVWTPSCLSGSVGFCNTEFGVSNLLSWLARASPSLKTRVGICYCWLCTQIGYSLMGWLSLTSPDAVKCQGCLNEAVVGSSPWFPSFQEAILANYLQNVPLN